MRLLPFDHVVIDSPLPLAQAHARLRAATGARRFFRFGRAPYPFEGEVNGTDVRIRRAIGYNNTYLPRIHGRLEPRAQGSRLAATMSMHPFTIVFSAVWLAAALLITILAVPTLVRERNPLALIPFAVIAFVYTLMSVGFWVEARIARRKLAAILRADPPPV